MRQNLSVFPTMAIFEIQKSNPNVQTKFDDHITFILSISLFSFLRNWANILVTSSNSSISHHNIIRRCT